MRHGGRSENHIHGGGQNTRPRQVDCPDKQRTTDGSYVYRTVVCCCPSLVIEQKTTNKRRRLLIRISSPPWSSPIIPLSCACGFDDAISLSHPVVASLGGRNLNLFDRAVLD